MEEKVANVILNEGFNKTSGVVVDTHVKRTSNRLGICKGDTLEVKKYLEKKLPKKYWKNFALWLIMYGKTVCKAQKPECEKCKLRVVCKEYKFNK